MEIQDHLIRIVREMFMKYGIKSVSMDDIAREVGISKKTLYEYIKDKAELIDKILIIEVDEVAKYIQSLIDKGSNAVELAFEIGRYLDEKYSKYNPSVQYDLKKYYPLLFKKLSSFQKEKMLCSMIWNIRKGKEEGLFRNEIKEEIIANLQVTRLEVANDFHDSSKQFTKKEIMHEVFVYHMRGICTQEGIKVLENLLNNNKN